MGAEVQASAAGQSGGGGGGPEQGAVPAESPGALPKVSCVMVVWWLMSCLELVMGAWRVAVTELQTSFRCAMHVVRNARCPQPCGMLCNPDLTWCSAKR